MEHRSDKWIIVRSNVKRCPVRGSCAVQIPIECFNILLISRTTKYTPSSAFDSCERERSELPENSDYIQKRTTESWPKKILLFGIMPIQSRSG